MLHFDKAIINCAITGGDHIPSQSPHIPVTPEEMITEGVAAAEAGASIIHIHMRDPDTGRPIPDPKLFREVATGISEQCNAVVLPTTGGSLDMTLDERLAVISELSPEMATCNMGTMNYGLFPIAEGIDEYQFDWEEEFLLDSKDGILRNTFGDIERVLKTFRDHGTKPEIECYDVGHLFNTKHFYDRGLLEPPIQIQFVMGVLGGIGATPQQLSHMIQTCERLFGDDYSFSVIGAGRMQFPLACQGVTMGGHARVGLEDNIYLRKGELAESNAEMVSKAADLIYELTGRETASPTETREFFELKGQSRTAF